MLPRQKGENGTVIRVIVALSSALIGLGFATACSEHSTGPRTPADAMALQVGQPRTIALAAAAPMHVLGGEAGSEYVVVAVASQAGPVIGVDVSADGVEDVMWPPTPRMAPATGRLGA